MFFLPDRHLLTSLANGSLERVNALEGLEQGANYSSATS